MKIPTDIVVQVRERTDIVLLIGEAVSLRRAGANHIGLCPFHEERSPSFTVSAPKQFFYCFGCQKSGDAIAFLMEHRGVTFQEAVRELAQRAGVDLPQQEDLTPAQRQRAQEAETERGQLLRLLAQAAAWFEARLARDAAALAYVRGRGIGEEVQRSFNLGVAPSGWDGLLQRLEQKAIPHELAELAGLLVRREGGARLAPGAPATRGSHYDRFRQRLMFPLLSPSNEVLAFGARVLPTAAAEAGAKYINSPESPVYRKGNSLYGLHAAREAIRRARRAILVEGNFDVLALHQHGFAQAVAPMGTALTEGQAAMVQRLVGEEGHVVLMLDGDRAGRAATLRDIALFTRMGVDVRVAALPDGQDPDSFVLKDSELCRRSIDGARPAVDHVIDLALKEGDLTSVAGQAQVLRRVVPLLVMPSPALDLYVNRLAGALQVAESGVWAALRGRPVDAGQLRPQMPANSTALSPELHLVALLADQPALCGDLADAVLDRVDDLALGELLRDARDLARGGETLTARRLVELAPVELRAQVAAATLQGLYATVEDAGAALQSVGQGIVRSGLSREAIGLRQELAAAEQNGDRARARALLALYQQTIQRRNSKA